MRRIAQSCTGIPTLPPQDPEPCIACVKAKMQHRAISKSPDTPPHPTSRPLDVVSLDWSGPYSPSANGCILNCVITCNHTKYKWSVAVKDKSSDTAARCFEEFLAHAHRIRGVSETPRLVVSDGAPEFTGRDSEFATYSPPAHRPVQLPERFVTPQLDCGTRPQHDHDRRSRTPAPRQRARLLLALDGALQLHHSQLHPGLAQPALRV
jgi:hypothetical protein